MTARKQNDARERDIESEAASALETMLALDPAGAFRTWLERCEAWSPVRLGNFAALLDSQERNRDVWVTAMKRTAEMAGDVSVRQRESFKSNFDEAVAVMNAMSGRAVTPAEQLALQAAYFRRVLTKTIEDTRQMGDLVSEEQQQIFELLADRMDDFIDELRDQA